MIRLKIKEYAEAAGISQGGLARRANVDENTLKRIYRDPFVSISLYTLDKFSSALGIPAEELIETIQEDHPLYPPQFQPRIK